MRSHWRKIGYDEALKDVQNKEGELKKLGVSNIDEERRGLTLMAKHNATTIEEARHRDDEARQKDEEASTKVEEKLKAVCQSKNISEIDATVEEALSLGISNSNPNLFEARKTKEELELMKKYGVATIAEAREEASKQPLFWNQQLCPVTIELSNNGRIARQTVSKAATVVHTKHWCTRPHLQYQQSYVEFIIRSPPSDYSDIGFIDKKRFTGDDWGNKTQRYVPSSSRNVWSMHLGGRVAGGRIAPVKKGTVVKVEITFQGAVKFYVDNVLIPESSYQNETISTGQQCYPMVTLWDSNETVELLKIVRPGLRVESSLTPDEEAMWTKYASSNFVESRRVQRKQYLQNLRVRQEEAARHYRKNSDFASY